MGSRPPAVKPSEFFQRSPTSLGTCAVPCLDIKSSIWCSFDCNRYLVDEVRELDAAVEQARARVTKSAQKSMAAQEERSNKSVDLTIQMPRMDMCMISFVCPPCLWYLGIVFLCFSRLDIDV